MDFVLLPRKGRREREGEVERLRGEEGRQRNKRSDLKIGEEREKVEMRKDSGGEIKRGEERYRSPHVRRRAFL